MQKYKQFIGLFGLFSLFLWTLALINFIFIYRAHEYGKIKDLVQDQLQKNAIYGPAADANMYLYKMELARKKWPEIIALGSSRIMTMRQECFNRSFLNCGLGMLYLNQAKFFLEELFQFHIPRIIILGVDFWWFNDNSPQPDSFPGDRLDADSNLCYKIQLPAYWLWEHKISIRKYLDILLNGNDKNDISHYHNMGMMALMTSDGFRSDGSHVQSASIFGFKKMYDPQFKSTLSLLSKPNVSLVYARSLSEKRRQEFLDIVRLCQRHQVTLVVYIPPVASRVCQRMAEMKQEYGFIDELREFIATLPLETYDFHDPRAAGINDCEFIDGLHVGEVGYQKLLLAISRQNPASVLNKCLNIKLMRDKIDEFDGCVLTEYDPAMYNYAEVDFLNLGCKKKPHRALMAGRDTPHPGR